MQSVREIVRELRRVVDAVLGVYLDATRGFHLVHEDIVGIQKSMSEEMKGLPFGEISYLDKQPFIYGQGHPDEAQWPPLHVVTQEELKARNAPGGQNYIFAGNMSLVTIYQYWEKRFRPQLAAALGKSTDDLEVDVMGDVRRYRNSILHDDAVADANVGKNKVLKWFQPGDRVVITTNHLSELVWKLGSELADLTGLEKE